MKQIDLSPAEEKHCINWLQLYFDWVAGDDRQGRIPNAGQFKNFISGINNEREQIGFIEYLVSWAGTEVLEQYQKQVKEVMETLPKMIHVNEAYLKEHLEPVESLIENYCPDYEDMRESALQIAQMSCALFLGELFDSQEKVRKGLS